jgi:hypothetical protein
MRRAIAGFLTGLMLFTPTFQVFGDDIRMEVKGDLYDKLATPKGGGPGELPLVQGQFGAGLTPSVGACGINTLQSYIAGLANTSNLSGLSGFIKDWQSAGTAAALYGLATYLPVAKEALLGANTLSNFVAQLRGFSCSQTVETIKEFNYQDSFLIKRCIARQLGISVDEVDLTDMEGLEKRYGENGGKDWATKWQDAYKYCLNSTSLVDLFMPPDKNRDKAIEEAKKYLSSISPRSLARCYLGVNKVLTLDEIAKADIQTRAKHFLYMILPDISMDSKERLSVSTVKIVDTDGKERPATVADVMNIHTEDFERNFNKLIEDLKGVVKYDMDYESALEAVKAPLEEFEEKYGITAQDLAGILILVLKMRAFMEMGITANGKVDDKTLKLALMPVDGAIADIKEHFKYRAIERLQVAMYENALRLKEAEEMRKAVGSVATPGDKDGCLTGASTSQ